MKSVYNRPLRVFLCHSSDDKPAALKGDDLYDQLAVRGIDACSGNIPKHLRD
jgi:hypothetical protein